MTRVVFEAEASGGNKAGGLPHPFLSPFPPLPLSTPKFSDKPVGWKVRSSEGEVPRLPPTKTTLSMTETTDPCYSALTSLYRQFHDRVSFAINKTNFCIT